MQEEPPEELFGLECHRAGSAVVAIVLPAEGDAGLVDIEDAMIRDRNPMRIASQVLKDMLGPTEWFFGLGGHFKTGQWWSPQKRPMGMARDSVVLGIIYESGEMA